MTITLSFLKTKTVSNKVACNGANQDSAKRTRTSNNKVPTNKRLKQTFVFLVSIYLSIDTAFAAKLVTLNLKNNMFEPSIITISKNTKIKLVIINHDDSPEEFDSFDLNREKVIFANSTATLFVGPLPKGTYYFFGEYHPDTAVGKVIVTDCETTQLDSSGEIEKC
ncbi:cupredoxin domain-containing protein [Brumicola nitratireducens]|uniref:EfeO-type cupredoxin-like domain-containing protein n=1 Tax=Glaciecola nitratireducens (strain JCM 12485 / KCTC 12276 / FR1064) TaxID=1085623 RepID=G4QGL5_GLANF|nr:cupredoxin domain-containing protein [Glaciecola nitratireducens]AEP29652.1 hypothetical protein GNIT_1534 [Glaciecola nitratireducens FR1064]